jgi:hypothetical protein
LEIRAAFAPSRSFQEARSKKEDGQSCSQEESLGSPNRFTPQAAGFS